MILKMRVVHISTTDLGGAYEAAQRISDSLQSIGEESMVLVRSKLRESTVAVSYFNNIFPKLASKTKNFLNLLLSDGEVIFDKYGTDICKHPLVKNADVICLHWVNSFVSVSEVSRILMLGKPVFWIMHDMWPFTGGCHYAGDCMQYKEQCQSCSMVNKTKKNAVVYWQIKKKEHFKQENLYPVGPSRWISECAQKSQIFGEKSIVTIPNPIDTDLFYPKSIEERNSIRKKYGLSDDKKTILFGAAKVTNNPIKGFSYFTEAVQRLPKEEYQVLVLGESDGEDSLKEKIDLDVVYTGFVNNSEQLCWIYNAADLLVAPSLQENYSNTVLESLACGIPVVAFDVGGMSDLIIEKNNGYLAELKDAEDLAEGIEYVAQNKEKMGQSAREGVLQRNRYSTIGKTYKDLFEQHLLKEDENEGYKNFF